MFNVAIFGLGRVGKSVFRSLIDSKHYDIPLIIDINQSIENIVYILNFDSTYQINQSRFVLKNKKIFDTKKETYISFISTNSPLLVNFKLYELNYLILSSGVKTSKKDLIFLKKQNFFTIITNSDCPGINHYVFGVNSKKISLEEKIISSSICDSVAISPVLKLLKEYKVITGSITTIHPILNYQNALDGKSASWSIPGQTYGHYELGRSFINNLIPKPTSAIKAVDKVLNTEFDKFLSVFSYRVPTTIVGSADISLLIEKPITKKKLLQEISKINKNGKIISVNYQPLTSLDMIGSEYNCILDMRWFQVIRRKKLFYIKIVLWYDNEFGYSQNIIKLLNRLS